MKKALLTVALLTAFGAFAQDNTQSAESRAQSAAGAAAQSGSAALGNAVYIDQSGPTSQTVNATYNTRAEQILNGHTTEDANVHYSGTVRNENVSSGTVTTNQNVNYSGSQTLKNVPGIAMSGPASGPCTGASGGIGLAGPGWGVGLNGSSVMDDCRMRENTRVLGMAMQSVDGGANPNEKGELMVMFMDAARGLSAYNKTLVDKATKENK